ncbi:hypothetical protein JMJ55_04765 [Belnapia sp. T6]|uniref:Beta-barrel assembly machine subunit BamF n=1 Tax=Belnapia mucosa TaxID=2804532 RepID=A0ABS1V1S8_9PROT|nr:hypothetical protein [Belnapia mucosa]MBL6454624.1 hypothetical protein [Belnapia mucosa]
MSDRRAGRKPLSGMRPWRRLALASALLLLPGCETMARMDYLDQFFDPEAYAARHSRSAEPANPRREQLQVALPQPPVTAARASPPAATEAPAPSVPERDDGQWVRGTVRQNPWLAMDWERLTPAQQLRVERQLRGSGAPREAAAAWDTMGLNERTRLAFGSPSPSQPGEAPSMQDASFLARRP